MSDQARGRRPVEEITDPHSGAHCTSYGASLIAGDFPRRSRNSPTSSGYRGPSVRDQVNQLVRKRYVKRESRKARGLALSR